jgi:hypothetical protein
MPPVRSYLSALAATACLAAPAPISAAVINYAFDEGTMACFGDVSETCTPGPSGGFTERIIGYFTFDTEAINGPLPQVNFRLMGAGSGPPGLPVDANLDDGQNTGLCSIFCGIAADNGSGGTSVEITFDHSLADGTPDALTNLFQLTVMIANPPVSFGPEFSDGVTGGVTPFIVGSVPEPTSIALMGVALALFLLGWHPKFAQR